MQEKTKPVFVVATANQIHQLAPELLRKGRFDEIFFVDLPLKDERKEIFKIHLNSRNLNPKNYNIDCLAEQSEGMSGAEIEQSILSSLYSCLYKKAPHTTDFILKELKQMSPLSYSQKEYIEGLRDQYKNRFTSVN